MIISQDARIEQIVVFRRFGLASQNAMGFGANGSWTLGAGADSLTEPYAGNHRIAS